jgi:hypothetical protein
VSGILKASPLQKGKATLNSMDEQLIQRLSRNRDMQDVIEYYEALLAKLCDVRNVTDDNIQHTRIASKFIQENVIDKFKYKELQRNEDENVSYL